MGVRARLTLISGALVVAFPALAPAAPLKTPALKTAALAPASRLADPPWRLVGPFRGGWGEMVAGVASRPDTFYFAAAGGGVWRSDNAGRTWTSLFDSGPTAPIGALAISASDPNTLYIGAGQPEPRYDVAGGTGVFRSTDGGRTWRALGLEKTRHIGRIWVDPRDADKVLVAAVGDFFGPSPERGVFRSTDGGATWSQPLKIDNATGAVDLAADPANPDVLFAATWQARQYPWQSYFTPIAGPGSGVYKSADGGASWMRLGGAGWPAGPLGRISLAATRTAGGLRLYAVVSAEAAGGLYRSDDGGASWALVNADPSFSNYYASRVTVAPNDPDVVWLVGQSIRRCDEGGKRCEIVKGAPGGDDYHDVWINPAHPDHMATASDQGVVVSVDAGRTWSSWYNQPTGQFYHLATDNRFPYRIYAGQQDSGTVGIASRSDQGAITERDWRPVGGDERDYDIPDPDDPDIVYGSGLGGRISRFDARTGQVANIAPFLEPNYGERQTLPAHHFVWVTPLAVSRAGPTTLYLGGEVVFASTDRGAHWRIASPDLTGKTPGAPRCGGAVAVADAKACGYGGIWTLAPSPRHAGELWVGTDDGLIQFTRDGGAHWTDVTAPSVPVWAKIAAIDVSALQDGVAYAAVDNHRQADLAPRILATRDYGATWRDATGDLPTGHFVNVVRADPVKAGLLFAGTEVGAYVSLDDGAHWSPLQNNLPTASVNDLLIHGDDLIAATQGRALWVLDDLSVLRQADGAIGRQAVRLFAPADAVRVRFNNNHDSPLPPEEPMGQNPPDGAIVDYWLGAPARGAVTLDIRDAAGALVQRLTSEAAPAPAAEAYFAKSWIRPAAPLSRAAGPHRAVWNLRYQRPAAIGYEYSIAAVPGRDTPVVPGGPYAPPGDYTVTLSVDGVTRRAPLKLEQDPRTQVPAADFQASLELSQTIAAGLDIARRGFGEMAAAHAQLVALKSKPADPALIAQVSAMADKTAASERGAGFAAATETLGSIETDLESADLAPTQPQRDTVARTRTQIDALWKAWSATRDGDLATLNRALAAAGQKPVLIPSDDKLTVKPPEGGTELP
ncbi:MAG: hypothetical protein M3T55_11495 [Pseudomonadota bacterium]|nr:hypothetical protein [Pseudomonadota bacterium]